jgi:protein-S-isoprenylcysteine O-methyltransferase Ste14
MNKDTAGSTGREHLPERASTTRGVIRWLLQLAIFVLIFAASLFLAAGSLAWPMAWVYVGLLVADKVVAALVLIPRHPELLAARARNEGPRDLDRFLAGIMALFGPVVTLVVAGLDYRIAWSPQIPLAVQIGAVITAALGSLLTIWAMASNEHFYGVVCINREEGHDVSTAGPYQIVRHPGYGGAILFQLATPLILGSLWALAPAMLTVGTTVVRTALEERTLQAGLDGYEEYAQETRSRLVPGVW